MHEFTKEQENFISFLLMGDHSTARYVHNQGMDIMPIMRTCREIGPAPDAEGNPTNLTFEPIARYLMQNRVMEDCFFGDMKVSDWNYGIDVPHAEDDVANNFSEISQFILQNFDMDDQFKPTPAQIALENEATRNVLSEAEVNDYAAHLDEIQIFCEENFTLSPFILKGAYEIPDYGDSMSAEVARDLLENIKDPEMRKLLDGRAQNHVNNRAPADDGKTISWDQMVAMSDETQKKRNNVPGTPNPR